tara:strand:- start:380 stop:553 length:174 start_codon:yes stop_codon:yes gene_type:complete
MLAKESDSSSRIGIDNPKLVAHCWQVYGCPQLFPAVNNITLSFKNCCCIASNCGASA